VPDYAENSQALRDEQRAGVDLRKALGAGSSAEIIAELTAIHAAAEERVLSLRRRARAG
jgi:hypothetical protein